MIFCNSNTLFWRFRMTNPKEKEDIATRDDLNKNKGRNQKDQPK